MTETLKHARVTTTTPLPDGSAEIKTESYYEQLNSVQVETQQSIRTSKETFLADLLKCMRPLDDGISRKLTLVIETDANRQPHRIVKTWTIQKEYYGKKL